MKEKSVNKIHYFNQYKHGIKTQNVVYHRPFVLESNLQKCSITRSPIDIPYSYIFSINTRIFVEVFCIINKKNCIKYFSLLNFHNPHIPSFTNDAFPYSVCRFQPIEIFSFVWLMQRNITETNIAKQGLLYNKTKTIFFFHEILLWFLLEGNHLKKIYFIFF